MWLMLCICLDNLLNEMKVTNKSFYLVHERKIYKNNVNIGISAKTLVTLELKIKRIKTV